MRAILLALAAIVVTAQATIAQETPQRFELPTYEPIAPERLTAQMVREFAAPEARQGVAVDADHFYAVVNTVIAKYDKETGERLCAFVSPRGGPIRHLNSCFAEDGRLLCANSNFPEVPMASSIEIFDAHELTHAHSHSLGVLDEGSLTFFDRLGDGWIAGFAHYDDKGGLPHKSAAYASVVTYDSEWRRIGGWMLPDSVRGRMTPHAASGGAIGPDGLLYLFGHDRPEMYVLAAPVMGPVLVHVATVDVDAAGQAFAWDRSAPRTLYAINRPTGAVRSFAIPELTQTHPNARPFPS